MNSNGANRVSRRRPLSCLACRQHKLKCDRRLPCGSCIRYRREERCRDFPAPPPAPAPAWPSLDASSFPGQARPESAAQANVASFDIEESASNTAMVQSATMNNAQVARLAHLQPTGFLSDPLVRADQPLGCEVLSIRKLLSPLGGQTFWKTQLCQILPSQTQCDILLSYFFEHVNWLFQTVHAPNFRAEAVKFWQGSAEDVDLIWLSLLLQILSLSALYVPFETMEMVGVERHSLRKLAALWYQASRQALTAGQHQGRPKLVQIQVFSITQLYWYATNDIETLNTNMGQIVRIAQMLELDKDESPSRSMSDEMRHRLWWDLVDADTFQSMCLGRAPLIQVSFSKVPYPLNSNDIDLSENVITRPMSEPTQNSMNVYRARLFAIINQHICALGGTAKTQTYDQARSLDAELTTFMHELPWYLSIGEDLELPHLPPDRKFVFWQSHILRTCICTQIIRLYQPYLVQSVGDARARCSTAVTEMLAVYKVLRADRSLASWQKFFPQAYQIFSMAVTMAALLLVDPSTAQQGLLDEANLLASDLDTLEEQGCSVTIALHGSRVVKQILSFAQRNEQFTKADSEALIRDISIILGGETSTRSFIEHSTPLNVAEINSSRRISSQVPQQELNANNTSVIGYLDTETFDESILGPAGTENDSIADLFADGFATASADLLSWDLTGFLSQGLDNGQAFL